MQKLLTKQALVSLLASSLAVAAIGQERGSALATVPEYSDEASGWVRVEVAIFADSDTTALSSEVWEHAPMLRYPQNRRWLTRYDEIKALMDEWGESAVTVNTDGSVEVVPDPIIQPALTATLHDYELLVVGEPTAERIGENTAEIPVEVIDDVDIAADPTLGIGELDTLTHPETISSFEMTEIESTDLIEPLAEYALELRNGEDLSSNDASEASPSDGSQVPMDNLLNEINAESKEEISNAEEIAEDDSQIGVGKEVAEDDVDTAAIDAVDIFNMSDLTGASSQFVSMNGPFADHSGLPGSDITWLRGYAGDEEDVTEHNTITPEEPPPALPTPYQTLTLEMLKQGLDKLQQEANRTPVAALAWLQAPGDVGVPVVLDAWQQANEFPVIQGTIAFKRNDEVNVVVELWLNTAGDYLPPRFEAIEIPSASERVLVIETSSSDQAPFHDIEVSEFNNLRTGLNTDVPPFSVDEPDSPGESEEQTTSPYRHAITISEQRDVREGYVRYIDHPALQVVATWRELSFEEVYELGESQRIRRDIDSLTRTLTAAPKTWKSRPQTAEPQSTDAIAP